MAKLYTDRIYISKDDKQYLLEDFREALIKEYPELEDMSMSAGFLFHKLIQNFKGEL